MSNCQPFNGGIVCTIAPRVEVARTPYPGQRWCFHCRARHTFEYVIYEPGRDASELDCPEAEVQCATCHTKDSDRFPDLPEREFIHPYDPEDHDLHAPEGAPRP